MRKYNRKKITLIVALAMVFQPSLPFMPMPIVWADEDAISFMKNVEQFMPSEFNPQHEVLNNKTVEDRQNIEELVKNNDPHPGCLGGPSSWGCSEPPQVNENTENGIDFVEVQEEKPQDPDKDPYTEIVKPIDNGRDHLPKDDYDRLVEKAREAGIDLPSYDDYERLRQKLIENGIDPDRLPVDRIPVERPLLNGDKGPFELEPATILWPIKDKFEPVKMDVQNPVDEISSAVEQAKRVGCPPGVVCPQTPFPSNPAGGATGFACSGGDCWPEDEDTARAHGWQWTPQRPGVSPRDARVYGTACSGGNCWRELGDIANRHPEWTFTPDPRTPVRTTTNSPAVSAPEPNQILQDNRLMTTPTPQTANEDARRVVQHAREVGIDITEDEAEKLVALKKIASMVDLTNQAVISAFVNKDKPMEKLVEISSPEKDKFIEASLTLDKEKLVALKKIASMVDLTHEEIGGPVKLPVGCPPGVVCPQTPFPSNPAGGATGFACSGGDCWPEDEDTARAHGWQWTPQRPGVSPRDARVYGTACSGGNCWRELGDIANRHPEWTFTPDPRTPVRTTTNSPAVSAPEPNQILQDNRLMTTPTPQTANEDARRVVQHAREVGIDITEDEARKALENNENIRRAVQHAREVGIDITEDEAEKLVALKKIASMVDLTNQAVISAFVNKDKPMEKLVEISSPEKDKFIEASLTLDKEKLVALKKIASMVDLTNQAVISAFVNKDKPMEKLVEISSPVSGDPTGVAKSPDPQGPGPKPSGPSDGKGSGSSGAGPMPGGSPVGGPPAGGSPVPSTPAVNPFAANHGQNSVRYPQQYNGVSSSPFFVSNRPLVTTGGVPGSAARPGLGRSGLQPRPIGRPISGSGPINRGILDDDPEE